MMEDENLATDATAEQGVQREKNEYANWSVDALNDRVDTIKKLFHDNKIKSENAFDIPIINLVLQIVKTPTVDDSNKLELCSAFDAISKVYACRTDDYLSTVSKFMDELQNKSSHQDPVHVTNDTIKTARPKTRVMLTTSEKLNGQEHKLIAKTDCYVNFKNDIVDYARPSRVLLNRFSNDSYWPEYKSNTQTKKNNVTETFKVENLWSFIENAKICPDFHGFTSKRDRTRIDFDLNQLDLFKTCDQDTSELNEADNISGNDDEQHFQQVEPMDVEEQDSTVRNVDNDVLSFDKKSNNLSTGVLSQILPLVNPDHGDYSFFDSRITNLPCRNEWTEKFKCPRTIGKTRPKSHMLSVDYSDHRNFFGSNTSANQQEQYGVVEHEVNFSSDLSEKLEKLEISKNQCNYHSWTPVRNISFQVEVPNRRLKFCEFISLTPKWYEATYSTTTNDETKNSSEQFDSGLVTETVENIGNDDSSDKNQTEINGANNSNVVYSDDDTNDEDSDDNLDNDPEKLDMHQLKKYILSVINAADVNITFTNVMLEVNALLLSNRIKSNISNSDIYVALLHLSNEHNLHLTNVNSGDIIISKNENV